MTWKIPFQNRHARWTLRVVLYVPFALWLSLFVIGWFVSRPEHGPLIEKRTLVSWHDDLPDFRSYLPKHTLAIAVLRRNREAIMPTLLVWAYREEAYPVASSVYWESLDRWLWRRKGPGSEFGWRPYLYSIHAARILGFLGADDPRVVPALESICSRYEERNYTHTVAREALARIRESAPTSLQQ